MSGGSCYGETWHLQEWYRHRRSMRRRRETLRVLALVGSARVGGNTDTIIDEILSQVEHRPGTRVRKYYLHQLDLRPCRGCGHCREHEWCAQEDGMRELYGEIRSSDAIILGSPVYMGQVSGQTKIFLDRCYALRGPAGSRVAGADKLGIAVLVCGARDPEHPRPALRTLRVFFRLCEISRVEELVAQGLGPRHAARERQDVLFAAREKGRRLAAGIIGIPGRDAEGAPGSDHV